MSTPMSNHQTILFFFPTSPYCHQPTFPGTPATTAMASKKQTMATKYEIRLITENDQPLKTAEKFWNYLSRNDASCIDYWKSIHVEKMIIFKFHDSETRDKALALEDFDRTLLQLKCKIPGSAPQGTDERSVFVNRLPSCLFIYFEPDTLESAIEHFINQMYINISNLFDHHLIRPPTNKATEAGQHPCG